MSPIPSDPLKRKPFELTTKDGKKITLKAEGLEGPKGIEGTVQKESSSANEIVEDDEAGRDAG
jgi:hypothetical protein